MFLVLDTGYLSRALPRNIGFCRLDKRGYTVLIYEAPSETIENSGASEYSWYFRCKYNLLVS